jgi:hypothetical protein
MKDTLAMNGDFSMVPALWVVVMIAGARYQMSTGWPIIKQG